MTQVLYIIRGAPGSGKSTAAKALGVTHCEADMYFITSEGKYVFDRTKLGSAHAWCQQQVKQALSQGESVVVSNTFTKHWEFAPYVVMAEAIGVEIVFMHMLGQYRNVHGVSDDAVNRMRMNFEI